MKSPWPLLCVLLGAADASAHENDRGMDYRGYKDRYGQSCCDVRDCVPAADFVGCRFLIVIVVAWIGRHILSLVLKR